MADMECFTRLSPSLSAELADFLNTRQLSFEADPDYTVIMRDGSEICGAGSRKENVLRCLAVSPAHQEEGLAVRIVTELIREAVAAGTFHLFLFTKPKNRDLFSSLGFYPIAETDQAVLLENRKNGIMRFINSLPRFSGKNTGCIVMHCNPITKGHLHLIEEASKQCGHLYLFILTEKTAPFTPDERFSMVKKCVAHLENVSVHGSSDYLISHITFPDYFYPDKTAGKKANCKLDLTIFGKYFSGSLGITTRFAGEEPYNRISDEYNMAMAEILPHFGISVWILPRYEVEGRAVSATDVRAFLRAGNMEQVKKLVPETIFDELVRIWKTKEDSL